MTCAPTATRTRDLPLRRSFVCSRLMLQCWPDLRLLVALVLLDVARFGSLWARRGHAARPSMRTVGTTCWQSNCAAQHVCGCLLKVVVACLGCCTSLLYVPVARAGRPRQDDQAGPGHSPVLGQPIS